MIALRGSMAAAAREDDPIAALLDCHARIRHFSAMARRLVELPDAPAADRADAATRVHRYFAVGLGLHVDDEDDSLSPRLAPRADANLRRTLDDLTRQHRSMEPIVARLLPGWKALGTPIEARPILESMGRDTLTLESMLLAHLAQEEEAVFPQMPRLLSRETLGEIRAEMRARRGPESD